MSQRRSALGRGLGALISNPNQRKPGSPSTSTDRDAPASAGRGANARGPSTAAREQGAPAHSTQNSVDAELRSTPANSAPSGPQKLDVEKIDPNPEQPRREFEASALEQLAQSIKQHGVLQPVVVRRAGDRFELIMGERRFRASQLAGEKTIPAVVADVEPDDRLELAIVENVQRRDLNPMELAHAYHALAQAGHTQEEIGKKVAMDRSSIANHIRLLDLSRAIQADVETGKLSLGHAKALLGVSDPDAREALRGQIHGKGLSVRATEKLVREANRGGSGRRKPPAEPANAVNLDADTRAFVERIERRLQTKVSLHPGANGSGRIEIRYFNLEDLERVGGLLLGADVQGDAL